MGVDLGTRLMPAHQEVNAKGFLEDLDFNALNKEMLDAMDSDWCYLSPVRKQDVEMLRLNGFHTRAIELLSVKSDDSPAFGIKDPRMTKLLPFWEQVFEHSGLDVRYVLSLRNPMSVAKSLAQRDGLDFEQSYLLWLDHVLRGMAESRGAKRVLVDYDLLMSAPAVELKKIAETLELSLDSAELEKYQSEFLDEALRHGRYQLEDVRQSEAVPVLVREIFEVLYDVAQGKLDIDNPGLLKQVEVWRHRMDDMRTAMRLADRYWAASSALNKTVAEQNERITERDERIDDLVRILVERDKRIDDLDRILVERDERIDDLGRILVERDKQVAELNEETVRRGHWALGLDKQLQDVRLQLDGIIASNSWKITRPLREVRRWLANPDVQARRYLSKTIRLLKRFYSTLPLDYQARANHRRFIAKYLPRLLHFANTPAFFSSALAHPGYRPEYDPDTYRGGINLATSLEPVVSVIIPMYGNCGLTLRCLASISDNPSGTKFEVIVIDDCSPDNSVEVLQRVGGIRRISNNRNQGFVRSCNTGAQAAKGQYIYFLNNDTEVMHGWLDELVNTFDTFSGTGLVGSKLIYPDGSLQEAGGIIWQDGSAWNFGRDQDPALPIFNYSREVDYCSGASIMIPKALFDDLGGFDEHYLPAYCEDSDIALKIRDKGYRVIYQPLSTVVHYEGLTSGTDTTQGVKAYQLENSKKLFTRWQERLQQHQANGENVDDAKDRCAKRRVLVLDHCTPTPDQDAGSITVFNLMLLLREMSFQVTFIPEDNFLYMPEYTPALQRAGIEVLYSPYVISVEQHLKDNGYRYDLAFLFRPGVVERHLDAVRAYCPNVKVLYHTIDLHFLRMQREGELEEDAAKKEASAQMKRREYALIRAVDAAIVHSTAELDMLRPDMPDQKISVFPLIMDVSGTKKGFGERRDIVFIGGYQHIPNVDAVLYFVSEVMPILRQRLPGIRFFAVGSKPSAEILALASDDVEITGYIEELPPLLDKIRVAISPLRYGAGIKGKIGMTMSLGLPTVATTLSVEGMSLTDGKNILVADGAEPFASAIVRLHEDAQLWHSISESGVEFAGMTWGEDAALNILTGILNDLGVETKCHNRPLKLYPLRKR